MKSSILHIYLTSKGTFHIKISVTIKPINYIGTFACNNAKIPNPYRRSRILPSYKTLAIGPSYWPYGQAHGNYHTNLKQILPLTSIFWEVLNNFCQFQQSQNEGSYQQCHGEFECPQSFVTLTVKT